MKKLLIFILAIFICCIAGEVLSKNKKVSKKMNYTYGTKTFTTPEAYSIPSSYFLDLRAENTSTHECRLTADWLILHDNSTPWKTISLTTVDETNDIETVGVGGRDQASSFSANVWIYYYIIYNPTSGEVSSLSSLSSTSPTLPTGFIYFLRVRSDFTIDIAGSDPLDTANTQLGDKHWKRTDVKLNEAPTATNSWQEIDLSSAVPPTAKSIFGYIGNTTAVSAVQYLGVAKDIASRQFYITTIQITALKSNVAANTLFFDIQLTTPQQMAWIASTTDTVFAVYSKGYIDDL
jgi:hypothetical protein